MEQSINKLGAFNIIFIITDYFNSINRTTFLKINYQTFWTCTCPSTLWEEGTTQDKVFGQVFHKYSAGRIQPQSWLDCLSFPWLSAPVSVRLCIINKLYWKFCFMKWFNVWSRHYRLFPMTLIKCSYISSFDLPSTSISMWSPVSASLTTSLNIPML